MVWHISYRSSITVSLAPSGSSQQFSCVPHVIRKIHENPILPIFNFLPGADTLQAWPRVATVQQTRQERTTVPSTSSKGREKWWLAIYAKFTNRVLSLAGEVLREKCEREAFRSPLGLEPCGSSEDLEKDRISLYDQSSSASSHQIFRIPSPLWQIHSNISWIMLSCSCLIFQIWMIGIILYLFKTSFHQQLGSMLYIYSKAPKKR